MMLLMLLMLLLMMMKKKMATIEPLDRFPVSAVLAVEPH